MNTIMQLRKICNHPYMFQQIEVVNYSLFEISGERCVLKTNSFNLYFAGIVL